MAGQGINAVPAPTVADVGTAIGRGTDVATGSPIRDDTFASLRLLQPILAAGVMAFSSEFGHANSLLCRRYAPDHDDELLSWLRRSNP